MKPTQKAQTTKEKHKHTYDVPQPADSEVKTQYSTYKLLEAAIKCEAHKGHCYVESTGGCDNHRHLSHQEMMLWAKSIVSQIQW